jgi:large subunit ribosomal protein L9
MKVILREDVEHVGEMGNTVTVSAGFARNFLIPRNLAVASESASAQQIEHELRLIKRREETVRAEQAKIAKGIESVNLEFAVRAGENGKIFGSITTANIADKLAEAGHTVSRKAIKLSEPIKSLGAATVAIKLATGIEANVKLTVIPLVEEVKAEEAPAAASEEAAAEAATEGESEASE